MAREPADFSIHIHADNTRPLTTVAEFIIDDETMVMKWSSLIVYHFS